MRRQQGMSLTELVVVVAVMSAALVATISFSMPWMARESLRIALHDSTAGLQLAKTEAATRNQPARLVVDTSLGSVEVWDTKGTGDTSDDSLLHERRLPGTVVFARPDAGSAVTMDPFEGSYRFQTTLAADGTVTSGTGDVFLYGGGRFGRVSIHAAGGSEVRYWDGSRWLPAT